ncbi:AAA domain-containing protein [Amycolatopsis taiwanensis]|uniref:PLD phosphodiesterase domain-containing protein n=1 Tax=Amycolatopsis taiwanensis TaxID=342230 RepID=A0A9W6VK64_9PSEU|nr:AAA domain-containing protein [Amycolatopsis taiwanensis]GLY70269.1 hypothetical protein Atai01_68880 [Amycolatopsis taiwanensis]
MSLAEWKSEAISAVEHWLTLQPGPSAQQRWKPIGSAKEGNEPGWLLLDKRGDPVKLDTLNDLCFAGNGGPDVDTAYPIETFRQVDGVLLLKEPAALPKRSRTVWSRSMSVRLLTEKLISGLRESGNAHIADAFATDRLAPHPMRGIPAPPGLVGAQADAYRACLSEGVRLVWGPPGAGKTRVLARAIEDLVNGSKRVLLVSTANVAVDNALHAVVKAMRPKRGAAIRVGPAQLAEVANNPDVHLQQLAAAASNEVDRELRTIERQLAELDGLDTEIATLSEQVGDFAPTTYRAALERIENGREFDKLALLIRDAEALWEAADRKATAKRAAAQQAQNEWNRIAGAREALNNAQELTAQLNRLVVQHKSKQAEVTAAELRLTAADGWLATRKAKRARDKAAEELHAFEQLAAVRHRQLSELIGAHRASAQPITGDYVAKVDTDLGKARKAVDQADQSEAAALSRLRELRDLRQARQDRGLPTDVDHEYVRQARSADLPGKFERLERVRGQQRNAASQRGKLEEAHRLLVNRSRKLRRDAEKLLVEEAGLVATTLARSRMHPALAKADFDVVLVDEAGAAVLAEVLLALCRATKTAVLFGDFLQLPPVQDRNLANSTHEQLRRWVLPNPFTHAGIRTPNDALQHPGCVTLLHQFRFGPGLRQLANDVIYEVLRDASDLPGVPARQDTEIVFVDTSSLGEMGEVRRPGGKRGWWPAGLVLSRALAEHHLPEDNEVGIVTPYTLQRDATLAGLRDRGLVAGVSVGTVHAFQGREFPTVVFDLVEDGNGWVAKSRRDAGTWEDDGVRLFGVGITRAQHRLYLIADLGAVQRAAHGPLAALTAARRRGRVRLWSAAALLGMEEPLPQFVDNAFTEVSEMLRQLVTASDISDEKTFYIELEGRLRSATRQVWMWSPWISTRAKQVVPLIAGTVARGVDVRVFIRPDEDRNMAKGWAQDELPALHASGATVIRSHHEHRKIVVIDEEVVLFGSLNALSSSTKNVTRESMLTLEGSEFAHRLLEELRVRDLGTLHLCERCGKPCEVRRASGRSTAWSWYCTACRKHEPVPEPSQHSAGGPT